ncbi:hypothetical protein [Streptomyces sp. B6B3]|uniref:hypothetical protein n=1 Tax=Streptomyces sp. B6B3 TaxID=3153570 RepID=UPI00325D1E6D
MPEADAAERLTQAVRAAETALIEFEIAVESFRIEVRNFSRLHERRLGPLYARLEELDARVAEAVAARTGDPEDQRKAREARALVTPLPKMSDLFDGWLSAPAASGTGQQAAPEEAESEFGPAPAQPTKVRPGPEARKLYRDLVRSCHPDLAADESERARRETFLVRVNDAYALGDADALRALTAEWEAGPRPPEMATLRELEELAARLEWLARRKDLLAEAVAELEQSAIGSMLRMAQDDPDGLLSEIAADLHRTLATREAELSTLLTP